MFRDFAPNCVETYKITYYIIINFKHNIMNKTLRLTLLCFIAMLCGGASWAAVSSNTYSYVFTSQVFSASGQTKDLGFVDWTVSASSTYFGWDANGKGQQFGKAAEPASSLILSTSDFSGTITSVKVNTSGAKDIEGTLTVTVGDTQFGEAYTLTKDATDVEFTGSASGEIKLIYSNSSAKALYIKSIEVTYAGETAKTGVFYANVIATANVAFATGETEITSEQATLVGGKMYAISEQADNKNLIGMQNKKCLFCFTNNNTYFKIVLDKALAVGDVVSATTYTRTDTELGIFLSTATTRPDECATQLAIAATDAQRFDDFSSYTVAEGDGLAGATTIYLYRKTGKSTYFTDFKITRKNVAGGGDDPIVTPTVAAPTFDPVAGTYKGTQKVTITAEGAIKTDVIPLSYFNNCEAGGIPEGFYVKFGNEEREAGWKGGSGSRMFNFAGGDFTKGLYFRDGYVMTKPAIAFESGKRYYISFNSAQWKDSGAQMSFDILKDNGESVFNQIIDNTPNVNGSTGRVEGSTLTGITFIPSESGNYTLKWTAEGWREVLLANVHVFTIDGPEIFYTTNGTDPDFESDIYVNPLTIESTTTVKAIAVVGKDKSNVATAEYTILLPPAAPTFAPAGGTYYEPQSVTLACSEGAEIYYSLDGSDPKNGTKYTEPINIATTTTVKAVALANEDMYSDVVDALYTIVTTVNPDDDALQAPAGWTSAITNGNLAGSDVASFKAKEYPSNAVVGASIVPGAGKNFSRGIVVANTGTPSDASEWATQFWIDLGELLSEGTKVHVEFDYRADHAATAPTQAQGVASDYNYYVGIGDVNFTEEWSHFSTEFEISAFQAHGESNGAPGTKSGMGSIAFNLTKDKSDNHYYFDNFGVWIQKPQYPWTEAVEELIAENGVAVDKLKEAVKTNNEATINAAIEQYKADNKDQENDLTDKVGKALEDWSVAAVNNYHKASYSHNGITLVEHFGDTSIGDKIWQDVSVENGTYNVELYATSHNAHSGNWMPVSDSNPAPTLTEDATDVAYVFARSGETNLQTWITARKDGGMNAEEPGEYAIKGIQVENGALTFGLALDKAGMTEWHTIQIKSLVWFATAQAVYDADFAELQALLATANANYANENKTNGKEDLKTAIDAAQHVIDNPKWYNIPEIEQIIANLKQATDNFVFANYSTDLADGDYFIVDKESGKMMAAGHNYGTRGIVSDKGLDMAIKTNTESRSITIDTKVFNQAIHFLAVVGGPIYADGPETNWNLDYQGEGYYITNGTQYINIDEGDNLALSDTPREWIFVSREERLAELKNATEENPLDATWLISGANFSRNDSRNNVWTIEQTLTGDGHTTRPSGGSQENSNAEAYHTPFTFSQILADAPKGNYQLVAQGFFRQDDSATEDAPVFFINDQEGAVPERTGTENSMSEASNSFTQGLYTIEPIELYYNGEGDLTVGVTGTGEHQWVIFDNFQLTYLGDNGIVLPADLQEALEQLNAEIENAINVFAEPDEAPKTAEEALLDVIDEADALYKQGLAGNATIEEIADMIQKLKDAETAFKKAVSEYNPTTGIAGVTTSAKRTNVYTLNGQKVEGKLTKGVYVINGRKVVIK
jgi:hypothetical protein